MTDIYIDPAEVEKLSGTVKKCVSSIENGKSDINKALKLLKSCSDERTYNEIAAKVVSALKKFDGNKEDFVKFEDKLNKTAEAVRKYHASGKK